MKHKYLYELTSNKDNLFPFSEDDYPDMDVRDTWNMDHTIILWMYERLKFFREQTPVNLDFHRFEIDGEELTQAQCIDRMIEDCKICILADYVPFGEEFEKTNAAKDDLFKVWSAVHFAMWW